MSQTVESALIVRCERKELLAALQTADAVVPTNSAKPILTNLLLDARDGQMEIVATDQQVGLRAVLRRLDVESPGQAVVPARKLVGILKESQSGQVLLALENKEGTSQVRIELSDGDYRVPAVVGETFPTVSAFPDDVARVAVVGEELERMIRQTSFAVDRDRSSAVLSGVLLRVADGECLLAATDGKVLAEALCLDDSYVDSDLMAIVPHVTITHLSRILSSHHPQQVEVALNQKLIFIRVVIPGADAESGIQVELTSRLVEGSYPSYRNALPMDAKSKATFGTSELASAVRRTALMTSNASRAIILDIAGSETVLSNLNNSSGSARIPLNCNYNGVGERFGLNSQYLGEILKAFTSDKITLELNGPGKGIIAREQGVTFLIMPITLPN